MTKKNLSLNAYAKSIGVSWSTIKRAKQRGELVIEPNGKVDPEKNCTFAQALFLNSQTGVSKKSGKSTSGIESSKLSELRVQKEREIIREKKLKNEKFRGELVDRRSVSQIFNKLWSVDSSQLIPIGTKLSPEICSICKNEDPEIITRVRELIDKEIWRVLGSCKRIMSDYLSKIDAENLKEEE